MIILLHFFRLAVTSVIPCIVYITSGEFTPDLRQLWADNMKQSRCTLHHFNNTRIHQSVVSLGIAREVNSVRPWAFKVDLWRYAQLARTGGMFFDAELRLHQAPERIFDLTLPKLQIPLDRDNSCLYNAVMASPQRSAAIHRILLRALSNVRARSYGQADSRNEPWLGITGPCTAGRAVLPGTYKVVGRHIAPQTINNVQDVICSSVEHAKRSFTNATTHYGHYWGAKTVYIP